MDMLSSLNVSSKDNEATTGGFSWTSGELMFYVGSATWAIVWERGKGMETRRLIAKEMVRT